MKSTFKRDFDGEPACLEVLSRSECCQKFGVHDGNDNIKVINDIITKLPKQTVILFDESPLTSTDGDGVTPSYNWTSLKNERPDVSVIISLQPVRMHPTLKSKQHNLEWPADADVIELKTQFRSTQPIHKFISMLCKEGVPVECSGVDAKPSDTIYGPDIQIVGLEGHGDHKTWETWIDYQLRKIKCTTDQLKIIHTDDTEKDAREIIKSKFEGCLTTMKQYQGSQSPIVIVFYSKEETQNYSNLVDMASRAQYQAIFNYS